jgi:hypothetical protein
MDKGEFARRGYTVSPAEGGSFVVRLGDKSGHEMAVLRGFSNHRDLLLFLAEEHGAVDAAGSRAREKIDGLRPSHIAGSWIG